MNSSDDENDQLPLNDVATFSMNKKKIKNVSFKKTKSYTPSSENVIKYPTFPGNIYDTISNSSNKTSDSELSAPEEQIPINEISNFTFFMIRFK